MECCLCGGDHGARNTVLHPIPLSRKEFADLVVAASNRQAGQADANRVFDHDDVEMPSLLLEVQIAGTQTPQGNAQIVGRVRHVRE